MRPIIHASLLVLTLFHCAHCFLPSSGWKTATETSRRLTGRSYPFLVQESFRTSVTQRHVSRTPSSSNHNQNDVSPNKDERTVVYQKIVSTPPKVDPVFFLGHLVDYLTEYFVLPSNLPIPFQVIQEEEEEEEDNVNIVVTWDSPLSSNSETTRLCVEVVGIYTTDKEDSSAATVPNMAMVVVKKKVAKSSLPVMMKNLFDDSERQIVKALEVGLENFVAGKIKMKPVQQKPDNFNNAQEAIQAEVMEQGDLIDSQPHSGLAPEDVFIDTTAVSTNPEPKTNANPQEVVEDYAVQAAKQANELHKKKKQDSVADATNTVLESTESKGDFAVEAAKRIAMVNGKSKQTKAQAAPPKSQGNQVSRSTTSSLNDANGFRTTISTPRTWKKNKAKIQAAAKTTSKKTVKKKSAAASAPVSQAKKAKPSTEVAKPSAEVVVEPSRDHDENQSPRSDAKSFIDAQVVANPKPTSRSKVKTKRKINLRVVDSTNIEAGVESDGLPFQQIIETGEDEKIENNKSQKAQTKATDKKMSKKTVTKEQMERDVMEAAKKAMEEMASDNSDMSAEELVQDVVEFGKAKDKEEAVGQGFATGAFEKAKELLQERHAIREQSKQGADLKFKEVNRDVSNSLRPNIMDPAGEQATGKEAAKEEESAEEELKRIFRAGERVAEGRITTMSDGPSDTLAAPATKKTTTEEDIDELIASDKTVSSYARILDEDLAELEVRINKSPGEELDGPKKNPLFDIFSGPELYNPNVDPETAVNWPGAQPGTKDVRLPKELDDAVKQAKFAAEVLMEMREERDSTKTRYYVGKKELSSEQVLKLRQCVEEAVQVGLISDPLVLLSERSRLQQVLDELSGQPEERFQDIISSYRDLLLSDNFVALIQDRLTTMADKDLEALRNNDTSLEDPHAKEREMLGHLVNYAQALLKETRALGAELEAAQLEIVRSICEVAMDPSHQTEEETSIALADAVRDMRPMLDDTFVAYLKYAVAEEEGRLARAGVLDDPQHNEWLFVLKIVQQGVYAEISRGISRYIDHIGYVLRMKTKEDRRALLEKLIDVMPTMDVRPFVQVVDNIAGSLGDSVKGEFDGAVDLGEMSNKVLQLRRDTHDLLPPERIKLMSRDADEWAAEQRKRLLEQRKTAQQRLKAAQETKSYDEELRSRGEVERMD